MRPTALAAWAAVSLGLSLASASCGSGAGASGPAGAGDAGLEAASGEAFGHDSGVSPGDTGIDAPGEGGCEQADAGPGCAPFVSCASLVALVVSFAADVLPVFQASCATGGSTCHGAGGTASWQVDLGGPDAASVVAALVGRPAAEDPAMPLVTAGDPGGSFFMHKLDGDQCVHASACTATGNPLYAKCGSIMPYNTKGLDLATRDTIRRWIAQGAKAD